MCQCVVRIVDSLFHCEFIDDANYFRINHTTGQLTTYLSINESTPCLLAFQIKVVHCSVFVVVRRSYQSID